MSHRYWLGRMFESFGYQLRPVWKSPDGGLNLVELAAGAMGVRLERVVQIGAFDGDLHDPLQQRVIRHAKRTVLVEPQPAMAQKLRERYQDEIRADTIEVVEAAIAEADGYATLYSDGEASPRASLRENHLGRMGSRCQVKTEVETLCPGSLMRRCSLQDIDLLQIDTEGLDWTLLKIFLTEGVKPAIVNFENLHLPKEQREESRDRLNQEGYEWREYGWDTVAVLPDKVFRPTC